MLSNKLILQKCWQKILFIVLVKPDLLIPSSESDQESIAQVGENELQSQMKRLMKQICQLTIQCALPKLALL